MCCVTLQLPSVSGLTLLGFKPKKRLKLQHYIKPANFIYPDETVCSITIVFPNNNTESLLDCHWQYQAILGIVTKVSG